MTKLYALRPSNCNRASSLIHQRTPTRQPHLLKYTTPTCTHHFLHQQQPQQLFKSVHFQLKIAIFVAQSTDNQLNHQTHHHPSSCLRRRPREPPRPAPKRRRRVCLPKTPCSNIATVLTSQQTPTRQSVVSLHTCSLPTSSVRTFVTRTLVSPLV